MSEPVLLTIKTDPKTKRELKAFATELGLTSTAFVNAIIRQALRDRQVVLGAGLIPTPYLEALIREVEADHKAGKNITRVTNQAELKAYLETI